MEILIRLFDSLHLPILMITGLIAFLSLYA